MKKQHLTVVLLTVTILWICVPKLAPAQDISEQIQQLTRRIENLEKLDTNKDPFKSELRYLRQTQIHLNKYTESVNRTNEIRRTLVELPREIDQLNRQLERPLQRPSQNWRQFELEKLVRLLDGFHNKLIQVRTKREKIKNQSDLFDVRRQQIPEEIAKVNARLEEIRLNVDKAAEGHPQVIESKKYADDAERSYLQQQLTELQLEQQSYENNRQLILLKKQLVEREWLENSYIASHLEALVSKKRLQSAEKSEIDAVQAQIDKQGSHPVVRQIALQNSQMAAELSKIELDSGELRILKNRTDKRHEELKSQFQSSKEKLEQVGLTDALGLRLRSQLNKLPNLAGLNRRLQNRKEELNRVALRRMELEERLIELVDVRGEAEKRLKSEADSQTSNQLEEVEVALRKQKQQLQKLLNAYDYYFDETLLKLQSSEKQLRDITLSFKQYLSERVIWIQSAEVFGGATVFESVSSLAWILSASEWGASIKHLANNISKHLFVSLLFVSLVVVLLSLRRKIKKQTFEYSLNATRHTRAKFSDTAISLFLNLVLIVPFSVSMLFVAWLLGVNGQPFDLAIAAGLRRMAEIYIVLRMIYVFSATKGFYESHFSWSSSSLKLVRFHLKWFMPVAIPLAFIVEFTDVLNQENIRDSIGRLAFVVAMCILSYLFMKVFSPKASLVRTVIARKAGGWADRSKYMWYPTLVIVPLGLVGLTISGYYYSALQLEHLMLQSFSLSFLVLIIYSVFLNWLSIQHRKMAMEQARKKIYIDRLKSQEGEDKQKSKEDLASTIDVIEATMQDQDIDVNTLSAQTLQLSRTVLLFGLVVGLYFIWQDIIPAFNMLSNVELWTVMSTVVEQANGAERVIEQPLSITLAHVGAALLIIFITAILSRNIPGVLEFAVMQRLPFTVSTRYAVTTLVRYILIIVGVIWAFSALGIGWNKVQFLAAAITVGLGFGLQEIFANFVSGIIILLERQIRVGDAVTIGSTSGKVTKIRMRATTITDWNRKELIIPNKEFVTGQVINWSLSDPVLRLDLPIGVAYGTNTDLVIKQLLRVAKNSENVRKSPESIALFLGFGDSTLNFELRVFIHYDDIIPVRHELNMAINKSFKAAGIEIAFPQRDIHIKTLGPLKGIGDESLGMIESK